MRQFSADKHADTRTCAPSPLRCTALADHPAPWGVATQLLGGRRRRLAFHAGEHGDICAGGAPNLYGLQAAHGRSSAARADGLLAHTRK